MLQDVHQITENPPTQTQCNTSQTKSPIPPAVFLGTERNLCMGAGLPPILIKPITTGEFMDMTELLPDKLGFAKNTLNDDQAKPSKPLYKTVTNILEWTQYFTTYMAVYARHAGLFDIHYRGQHGI